MHMVDVPLEISITGHERMTKAYGRSITFNFRRIPGESLS